MRYLLRLTAGSALAAFGICTLLSHLLLSGWEHSAAAGEDAVARGVLLLTIFLPAFAITSICATTAFAILMTGRTGPPLVQKIFVALLGAAIGVVLIMVGGDPVVLLLPRTVPAWVFHGIGLIVAALALVAGLLTIIRLRRTAASAPAPAGIARE
ncbi:MAG TPA: hypothetical protein VL549_11545 [Gemmatimonadales bacterium]|nr:hypothetical protein [Gemmatimonadales bacterium]